MAAKIDFETLATSLLAHSRDVLQQWFPAGKLRGKEFMIGDLTGAPGRSLKINLITGVWKDFSDGTGGKDLISLYAAHKGLKQGEAARLLQNGGMAYSPAAAYKPPPRRPPEPPPVDNQSPDFLINNQLPAATWAYRDATGQVLFHIARYDPPGERKQFSPFCFVPLEGWVRRAWPAPRPLYGVELLAQFPDRPVLVVEGEKAADAARQLATKHYVVVTWPGGAQATASVDWTPLHGRALLLWPDADDAGLEAMETVARTLSPVCPSIKIINVLGQPVGWDAADAVNTEWTWQQFLQWGKPRVHPYQAPLEPAAISPELRNVVDIATGQPIAPQTVVGDAAWDALNLYRPGVGKDPPANLDTMLRIMEGHAHCRPLVWFDEFYQRLMHQDDREWIDADDTALTVWVQRELTLPKMPSGIVHEAVTLYGHRHPRCAPRDWIESLTWDGVERLPRFFPDAVGAVASEYTAAAGCNFWISMAARIYKPGCKVDTMVVLEGPQAIGKSMALAAIGGAWYAEASESVMSKDFFQILPGKLLVEVAELDSFHRAEITRIKQVISCQSDRYRPSYGRRAIDVPRMSVFVGTTNEDAYLRDVTGARRFWPIRCHDISMDYINNQRAQLFAEAAAKFKAGATWWDMPAQPTLAEQESRRVFDVWEESLAAYLHNREEVILSHVLEFGLGLPPAKQDRVVQLRVAGVLRSKGYERTTLRRNGAACKLWVRSKTGPAQASIED